MARPERFELPTNWFEASYSIQLSYGRMTGGSSHVERSLAAGTAAEPGLNPAILGLDPL
jgi:hypothetical protein